MKKILVIDDDEILTQVLGDMISSLGYECISAKGGIEGIELAKHYIPDLIISDIKMKGIDGFNVLKELKTIPQTVSIPFIFLTGEDQWKTQRHGMELGADDFIQKPVTIEDLSQSIDIQFKKSEERSKKAQKVIDELRFNISRMLPHELKTPLSVIISYLELLGERYYSLKDEDRLAFINNSFLGAKRLERIINNLLLYVELDVKLKDEVYRNKAQNYIVSQPGIIIKKSSLDAAKVFKRESDLFMEIVESPIKIFPSHFEKIINEIVRNSFQYSRTGDKVYVISKLQDNKLCITIQDFGKGMSEEQIKQINAFIQFERKIFEQQGVGLGLCIIKMLIEFYNGAFSIQSVVGQGTIIEVGLPITRT